MSSTLKISHGITKYDYAIEICEKQSRIDQRHHKVLFFCFYAPQDILKNIKKKTYYRIMVSREGQEKISETYSIDNMHRKSLKKIKEV